jgi:hypothetical protein
MYGIEKDMSDVYSASLEGLRSAELMLDKAARNIAAGRVADQPSRSLGDVVQISPAGRSAASALPFTPADYAAELISVKQAEIAAKANLKVLSSQIKLERETLDLFA